MRILTLAMALLLGACSYDLVAARPGALEFTPQALQHGEWLEQPEVEARGEAGRIVVSARLSAPDPCQQLNGELERSGSELKLRVTITRVGEACIQPIGTFGYQAVIRDLAPGGYRLRVIHTYPNTGWPTVTALDQTVEVR
jgi:hypothetical protein